MSRLPPSSRSCLTAAAARRWPPWRRGRGRPARAASGGRVAAAAADGIAARMAARGAGAVRPLHGEHVTEEEWGTAPSVELRSGPCSNARQWSARERGGFRSVIRGQAPRGFCLWPTRPGSVRAARGGGRATGPSSPKLPRQQASVPVAPSAGPRARLRPRAWRSTTSIPPSSRRCSAGRAAGRGAGSTAPTASQRQGDGPTGRASTPPCGGCSPRRAVQRQRARTAAGERRNARATCSPAAACAPAAAARPAPSSTRTLRPDDVRLAEAAPRSRHQVRASSPEPAQRRDRGDVWRHDLEPGVAHRATAASMTLRAGRDDRQPSG